VKAEYCLRSIVMSRDWQDNINMGLGPGVSALLHNRHSSQKEIDSPEEKFIFEHLIK
jgi:hypothetical protein